jgi:hypothetical protein
MIMGYRSEVAYAIVFKSTEDRDAVLSRITPEQQKIVREEANLFAPDRIYFHDQSTKWYVTRDLAQYGIKDAGYETVDAHDAFIQAAMEASENNEVYSLGIFIRLGEEDDDNERYTWGESDAPESFPELYDLVNYHRELTVGWNE